MITQPSPQGIAAAYQGNPEPLQRKMQQSQQQPSGLPGDLMNALALQMVLTQQNAAKNHLAMQQGAPQPTVVDQLQQQAVGNARQDIQQKIGTVQQKAQAQQQGMQQLVQRAGQAQGAGVDQLRSNIGMAGGGIVAFEEGGYTSQAEEDISEFYRSSGLEASDLEKQRMRQIAAAATAQREREYAQQNAAENRAGIAGYFGIPKEQYADAKYVRDNLAKSRNYGNEGRRAPSGTPATQGIAQLASPNAEAMRTRQVGNAGTGGAGEADRLAADFRELSPEQLRFMQNKAAAGDTEARNFMRLYKARFPEMALAGGAPGGSASTAMDMPAGIAAPQAADGADKFSPEIKKAILESIGTDRTKMGQDTVKFVQDNLGAKPILDAENQRTLAMQQRMEQQKGQRDPWYELLRGVAESRPGYGGVGMQLLGGANRAKDASSRWSEEDTKNQQAINALLNATGRGQLDVNKVATEAGAKGIDRADAVRQSGITAGVSAMNTMESAKARTQEVAMRVEELKQRYAQASQTRNSLEKENIRAQSRELLGMLKGMQDELNELTKGRLTLDDDGKARVLELQRKISGIEGSIAQTIPGLAGTFTPANTPPPAYNPSDWRDLKVKQ